MKPLSSQIVKTLRDFYRVKKEWNALVEASPKGSFFLTSEWLGTWWSVFGKGKRLRVLFLRDEEGHLVGGAPFYIRRRWVKKLLPIREIRFIGTGGLVCPDHLTCLAAVGYEAFVAQAVHDFLVSSQREWDLFVLSDADEEDPFCKVLEGKLRQSGRAFLEKNEGDVVPFIPLQGNSWETYVGTLKDSTQKNIRRRRKKLTTEFQMGFVRTGKRETLQEDMGTFMELHGKRRESIGGRDKFGLKEYRRFHTRLARKCAGRDWLHLSFLELNGERVAAQYGFEYHRRLFAYQTGFDPRYKQSGVFQVLLGYVIEDCCGRGFQEVDLLRGGESYKYDWTQSARKVAHRWIIGKSPLGRVFMGLHLLGKVPSLFRKIAGRFVQQDRFKVLVVNAQQGNGAADTAAANGFDYHWVEPEDRAAAAELARLKGTADVEKFAARLREGHRCFGVFDRGRLIHASWVSPKEWSVWRDSKKRTLAPGGAFLYDGLTEEAYRGKGIAGEVFRRIGSELVREGIQQIYCTISTQNEASLKVYARVGFRETGQEILTVRGLGRTLFEKSTSSKMGDSK